MLRGILAGALLCAAPAFAQVLTQTQTIEVTATRIAEDVLLVPASITIIDAAELRARNATDLASAVALASGLNASGGSDAGPAAGVPEMWGLREVDAFLLVVDGVPWGGAFNPDLPTVDLTGVDRIEIVRGSAPVIFGATSFVGVIHIIHAEAGTGGDARVSLGSFGSGSAAVSVPLSRSTALRQSLIASAERRGFRDDESQYDRGHLLYRAGSGNFRFDADATFVRQDPSSPHPRQGPSLSANVPLDANHNPDGARLDENRLQLTGGWMRGNDAVTLALTRSTFDIRRGFLSTINNNAPNAFGYDQDRTVTDIYVDAHTVRQFTPALRVIAGLDHLFGDASADSRTFEYFVPLTGGPSSDLEEEDDEEHRLDDRRNFSGVYVQAEFSPSARLRFDAGARINHTRETRNDDARTVTRPSGSVGVNYRVTSSLALFADYRNTYKPAAIDFGPESEEGEILEPEEAQSVEIGAKGALLGDRLHWQTSAFAMNFENLVVPNVRNGLPVLENAGSERFTGAEVEVDFRLLPSLRTDFAYSYHDARFRDYVRAFDGVPTQLSGRRFEMSPLHMASAGFIWDAGHGLTANAYGNYVGERYLTKRNTARAQPYTTWSAGLGWRLTRGELRVDGRNLSNARPPVAESELGDAQYYRLGARSFEVSYRIGL
ncbi:MAG TPA: TonB-dependent receptor [Thermoanaerobaculia bacterium]|jgi:outer membrane receptor protein involved in Fe transport